MTSEDTFENTHDSLRRILVCENTYLLEEYLSRSWSSSPCPRPREEVRQDTTLGRKIFFQDFICDEMCKIFDNIMSV